ncbi:hypothetical protein [Rhodospirillum centenum]|uniref:Uncharacterized protein n=1 Tax=Rhodospirillum centenum (strain ATCC 51521 / SW) TaxID=414684 RepID=B6IWP3_RHOCS|nr:hypothetical protein [Rhodospirillum centenum]ACJ00717.1 hypothetical protein RC1_3357 [Rhodospirillum centenum SW]
MFGRVLSWLRSNPSEAPPRAAPVVEPAPAAEPPPPRPPAEPGVRRRGPVFSSRAVRDAAVVTGAIETLRKFAAGAESVEDLDYRLAGLTKDQFAFLQISVGPELVQNCINRAAGGKGVKAASLRRTLNELAGIATPEPGPDRPAEAEGDAAAGTDSDPTADADGADGADGEPRRAGSEADIPETGTAGLPGTDGADGADTGTDLPSDPSGKTEAGAPPPEKTPAASGPDAALPPVPEPPAVLPVPPLAAAAAAEEEVVPALPHPRPAHEPALLPRLARTAADARRARLLDTLTDHLSASETSR